MDEKDTFPINPLFMQYGGRATDKRLLEQWIILLEKEITSRREVKGLAADSSAFNSKIVKLVCGAS